MISVMAIRTIASRDAVVCSESIGFRRARFTPPLVRSIAPRHLIGLSPGSSSIRLVTATRVGPGSVLRRQSVRLWL